MVAMNYRDLGDAAKARRFLERVRKEHPNTGSAQLAETELKGMKPKARNAGEIVANVVPWMWTVLLVVGFTALVAAAIGLLVWRLLAKGKGSSNP
jgi:hypothetical protein